MQKVGQFLERYCQWFAIGLGVLFLAFMVWTYFFAPTPPLAVTLGNKQVLPGHVNAEIDVMASKLEDEMNKKHEDFEIKPPPVLFAWQQQNSLADLYPSKQLANIFIYGGPTNDLIHRGPETPGPNNQVTELPTIPPAGPVAVVSVRTMANPQQANNAAQAGNAAGANPPAGNPIDVDVVSTLFTIDRTALAASFNKVFGALNNLPPNLAQQINETMVMSVDLIREEQVDGKWVNQTVIAPLPIHNIMALPPQQNPPANDAATAVTWTEQHTDDIVRPSYYPTEKGMPVIYSPDQPPPPVTTDQPAPAPAPVAPSPIQPGRRYIPGSNGPGGGTSPRRPFGPSGGTPRTGGGAMLTPPTGANAVQTQYIPGQTPGGMPPGMGNGPQIPGQAQVGVNPNQIQGKFDVTKLSEDIRILGHDDTVVPGHTYRYMVRYTLYNSIFGIGGIAKPAALATQFYLTSAVSQPTGPIKIPTRLRFFLASVFKNQVVFDVFTWQNGKWNKSRSKEISPGDAIPGTDWSVLDVRDDLHGNGERYALLISTDGTVERHEVKTDADNPDFESLENDTKSAQADPGTRAPGS